MAAVVKELIACVDEHLDTGLLEPLTVVAVEQ